jgi:hypothetical protein
LGIFATYWGLAHILAIIVAHICGLYTWADCDNHRLFATDEVEGGIKLAGMLDDGDGDFEM